MSSQHLTMHARPRLTDARMVLGLDGWMDGGDVSTGAIDCLVRKLSAMKLAEIAPEPFYVYSFPGTMELTALFRPHTKIEDGLITALDLPANVFWCDQRSRVILFEGKEPNFRWTEYAECVFEIAETFDVRMIYFVGSVAGIVPHTREPRIRCSVSQPDLKAELEPYGIRFGSYDGPASVITFMTHQAAARGLRMASLVAEIPAYIQGTNPVGIESMVRRMCGILGVQIDLDDLRQMRDVYERKVTQVAEQKEDLAGLIRKLEEDYDNEVFDTEMGDLKAWLVRQGIRLD